MLLLPDDFETSAPSLAEDELIYEESNQLFLVPTSPIDSVTAGHCSARLLQLSLWVISMLDLLLALLAIPFNALLVPSAFFARPIPLRIRRSLSAITLSYALLAGILLAKKCFWLLSALEGTSAGHCVPILSSVACKLQEFPVLFIFLHTLALSLAFVIRMALGKWCGRGNRRMEATKRADGSEERRRKGSTNNNVFVFAQPQEQDESSGTKMTKSNATVPLPYWLCSTQQILLVVTCLGIALLFTAFDQEPTKRKLMANCSIALAIRQKELAFALLSLILLSQLFQSLLWHFISARKVPSSPKQKSSRPSLMAYLMLSCRDLFLVEAVGWSLVALLTGISLVQQFVLLRPCTKCTRLAIELCFNTLPLLIALAHPIMALLFIAPIRYSAQRFCPILAKLFPTQEPVTPPLPRPFPTVRILITEH